MASGPHFPAAPRPDSGSRRGGRSAGKSVTVGRPPVRVDYLVHIPVDGQIDALAGDLPEQSRLLLSPPIEVDIVELGRIGHGHSLVFTRRVVRCLGLRCGSTRGLASASCNSVSTVAYGRRKQSMETGKRGLSLLSGAGDGIRTRMTRRPPPSHASDNATGRMGRRVWLPISPPRHKQQHIPLPSTRQELRTAELRTAGSFVHVVPTTLSRTPCRRSRPRSAGRRPTAARPRCGGRRSRFRLQAS